jgi:serine/threonine-protein kinase RIO1
VGGEVAVIDFPQAVDPKKNRHAEEFLLRDVVRLGEWFERHGVHRSWERIARDLWTGWLCADLLPADLREELG